MEKFVEASLCCKSVSDVEDFLAFKQAKCKKNEKEETKKHILLSSSHCQKNYLSER